MLRTLLAAILALAVSTAGAQIVNRPVAAGSISNPGTSLPATCAVGYLYFKSNSTAGQNLHLCTASNTWTQMTGGSLAVPVTPAQGGTGVANNASSTLTISGAFGTTLTVSGTTAVTLPTSGTVCASGNACTMTSVNFGGTTLANYVEGTWTAADGTAAALSITNTTTKYTRIGRMVFLNFDISYPATADGTNAIISGLPLTAANDQTGGGACHQGTGGAATTFFIYVQPSTATFWIYNAAGTRQSNAGLTTVRLRCTVKYAL